MTKRNYYEILGVAHTAGEAELKAAYRKLAMETHPDRNNGSEESATRFKEISEAYSVLSDTNKRATYDRLGKNYKSDFVAQPTPQYSEMDAYFAEIFKEHRRQQKEYQRQLDGDLTIKEHFLVGWVSPMFLSIAGVIAKCYTEKNEFQNLLIHIMPTIVNVAPYAAIGAIAGVGLDRLREAHKSATKRATKTTLLKGKKATTVNFSKNPMTACAVALGIVGGGTAYFAPWYYIQPFANVKPWNSFEFVATRPATLSSSASASSLAAIRPPQ